LRDAGKPYGHHEARSEELGYTAYFFVEHVGHVTGAFLQDYFDDVGGKNHLETRNTSSSNDHHRDRFRMRMKSAQTLLSIKNLRRIGLLRESGMFKLPPKTRPLYLRPIPGFYANDLSITGAQNYGISQ